MLQQGYMLTLVYSSKKRKLAKEKQWAEGAGVTVHILHYAASSFAKGYNKGLNESKTDVVVFVRDDVEFPEAGWGKKILERFERSQCGILGVVGSIIVPMSGLVWEKEEPLVGRIWYEAFDQHHEQKFSEEFLEKEIPVVAVDDACFAVHKKRLKVGFDERFSSDSFYDLDVCVMNAQKKVKIGVIFDIKVLKLGMDPRDDAWLKNQKIFINKHKDLPMRLKPEIKVTQGSVSLEREPKVAAIVASKGKPVDLASCLESIYERTTYPNLEIYVVDLGSSEEDLDAIREFISHHPNTTLITKKHEHLPTLYEEVMQQISSDTELLLFFHPEVILLNDAITRMVKAYLENPEECGTIGLRMHTKSNMVRHFGLQLFSTISEDGYELGLGYQGFQSAYKYQNKVVRGILGSSKEFLMIPKALYQEVGGFNKEYIHSLEDFELNLRTILKGKKNILVGTGACYFLGQEPKFLPSDFERLVTFVNAKQ